MPAPIPGGRITSPQVVDRVVYIYNIRLYTA